MTTPRLLSFWTNKPRITKEAVQAQLTIDGIRANYRARNYQPRNTRSTRYYDRKEFNGNPQ